MKEKCMKASAHKIILTVILCFIMHGLAPAAIVAFDDVPVFSVPTEQYSQLGVHFRTYQLYPPMVQPGLANGDTNQWGLDGTAGPNFLGEFYGYGLSLEFDAPISSFSL